MKNAMLDKKTNTEVKNQDQRTAADVVDYLAKNVETLHVARSIDKGNEGFRPFAFLNDGRDMNLTNMILNIESNNSNNYFKPLDVYKIYSEMKEIDNSPEFKKSLQESSWTVKVPPVTGNSLSNLKENDPKSFLVLPMLGKGHLWSTLIRKTDEGFSATVVNKGLRFWHDPIEEFVFKKENKGKLVDALNYTGFGTANSVEDVYRKFVTNSDKQYNMKINAAPQKVGNCFTKNIQGGIKLAYATRDMSSAQMRAFRINKEYTSFGTPDKDRRTFKWDMSTETMQKLFAKKMIEKNPNITPKVAQSVEIYSANKHFRHEMKENKTNIVENFMKGFDPENKTANLDSGKRTQYLLKDLTPYTYNKNRKDIDAVVRAANSPELNKQYDNLTKFTEYGSKSMGNLYFHFYMEARHDVMKSLEAVFDKEGKFKNTPPVQKAKLLLDKLDPAIVFLHKNVLMPVVEFAYGKENATKEYENLFERTKANVAEIEKTKPTPEMLKQISSTFPIIVGQVNHRISEYYNNAAEALLNKKDLPREALRLLDKSSSIEPSFENTNTKGQCFHRLGDYKSAVSEYTKAISISPDNAIAYVNRGKTYELMNNKMAARADFEAASKISPEIKGQMEKEQKVAVNSRGMDRN